MKHKVLFTSDLHGNEVQYRKLVNYATKIPADYVIIGGDIAPKTSRIRNGGLESIIDGQRYFLEKKLPRLVSSLKKKLPSSKLFLLMGNDDCSTNLDVLERNDPYPFQQIHGRRIKLGNDLYIVGYSYVPITPFGIKDWEKYDLSEIPDALLLDYKIRKASNYDLDGYKSTKLGWKKFQFKPEMEKTDSIQKDLSKEEFKKDADKTIYVFHSPPNRTNLDQVDKNIHVGSFAIRQFIENQQPYLTLHGHIHDTIENSGNYRQKIGKTLCLTSGNDDNNPKLSVLLFDLYDPFNVVRKVI